MFSYSYLPFISTPSRVTGHSKTLIDNIFCNKPMLNPTAGNISFVISDHLIQFLIEPSSYNATLEQTSKLQRYYKNFDKAKFINDLHKISWKEDCSNPDSNVALEHFLQIIYKLLDKHAPYVTSKSRSSFTSKPWITTAIPNSIKSKNKIYKKCCNEENPQQREIYGKQFKTYRNHLTTLLRITKDEYYKTHFQENKKDLKTKWKTIKEIINVKTKNDVPINSLLIGETITANAKLIANHFNTFSTSVTAKLNEKIVKVKKSFSHYLGQITDETIFLSSTTPADIESLIN